MESLPVEKLPVDEAVEEVGRLDLFVTARLLLITTCREGKDLPLLEGHLLLTRIVDVIDATSLRFDDMISLAAPEASHGRGRKSDLRKSNAVLLLVRMRVIAESPLPHLPNPQVLSPQNPQNSSLVLS